MGKLFNVFEKVNINTRTAFCPLCGREAEVVKLPARRNFIQLSCPNCGSYVVQPEFLENFDDAEHVYLLSGYLRHELRQPMTVRNVSVEFANQMIASYAEKAGILWSAANIIFHYEQKMTHMKSWCSYEDLLAIGYCKNSEDLQKTLLTAVACGYMESEGEMVRATELGMKVSEKVRRGRMEKDQRKIAELIMQGKLIGKEESGPQYRKWVAEISIMNARLLKEHPLHEKIAHMCDNHSNNPNAYEDLMCDLSVVEADEEFWNERKEQEERRADAVNNKIFIVHGRDHAVRDDVELKLRRVGLEPVILAETASRGMTIIEKIEANSDVAYAVVLYTACDLGKYKDDADLLPRARQNVVFEHGYMVAKLGRSKVVALVEHGVEEPGDLDGVVYISMDDSDWDMRLYRELRAAGIEVNII